jgi:hypothetical protein
MVERLDTPNRESKRKSLFYKFEILDEQNRLIGQLADLTANGLKVIGPDPVSDHAVLQLKMILPAGISEKKQISFKGECVWCRKVGETYHIGFKAQHTDPGNERIIKIIIDLLASPDSMLL